MANNPQQQESVSLFSLRSAVTPTLNPRYYVYHCTHGTIKEIYRNTFLKINGLVFKLHKDTIYVKLLGGMPRSIAISNIRQVFPHNFISDVQTGINSFRLLLNVFSKANDSIVLAHNYFKDIDKTVFLDMTQLIFNIMSDDKVTVLRILNVLIDLYKIADKLKLTQFVKVQLQSPHAGIEPFILSGLSLFLPHKLLEVIKRLQYFTNSKISDDPSILWDILNVVCSFIHTLVSWIPCDQKLKEVLYGLLNSCSFLNYRGLVLKIGFILKRWESDKRLVLSSKFREEVKEVSDAIQSNIPLKELQSKSAHYKECIRDFERLVKCIHSYESTVRKEPVCFIFEGPPGCLKSVTMGKLIQGLNMDTYTHLVKPKDDGKDFYDCYNGQKVFTMDDVGQQAISQWRNIINIVSPIKLPLECASVDLKDTKFFTSDIVMVTTNRFTELSGLLRDDGISDIKALWRRGNVFNFKKARNVMGSLQGEITFEYFDIKSQLFVNAFPDDIQEYITANNIVLPVIYKLNTNESCVSYLSWMKKIVLIYDLVRSAQYTSNVLTDEEMVQLQQVTPHYGTPTHFKNCYNIVMDMKQLLQEVLHNSIDYITTASEYVSTLWTSASKSVGADILIATTITVLAGISTWLLRDHICGTTQIQIRESIAQMFSRLEKKRSLAYVNSTAVEKISKHVFEIDVDNEDFPTIQVCGIISGHYLITVAHAVKGSECYVTAYKNRDKVDILLDKIAMKTVFRDVRNDVVVLQMPKKLLTPFKSIGKFFQLLPKGDDWLVTPCGNIFLPPHFVVPTCETYYENNFAGENVYLRSVEPSVWGVAGRPALTYGFGTQGLCASPVISTNGSVKGIHVSGNADCTECHAILWSDKTKQQIADILLNDTTYILDVDISDKVRENNSSIKIECNAHIQTPKESNYGPSPLYGEFPVDREPADLQLTGVHTIKDVEKKSTIPVCKVSHTEVLFARSILSDYMTEFIDLNSNEIVKGTELLAGLNKKSSNGFNCVNEKEHYINFLEGDFTSNFKEELQVLEEALESGQNIKLEDILWYATLKDELRNKEKNKKPRSFRVSRLHIQVLTKKYFGHLVEHLIEHRSFNGIMVGVNPFKEFKTMHSNLQECCGVWAGDIGSYDGKMLPQLQVMLNELVLQYYKGNNPNAAEFILTNMPYCYVGINDDVILTTHSMPSGSFLTAIFNSLINKAYTAMWFYRFSGIQTFKMKDKFHKDLIDYVYGDDKLNGLRKPYQNLNAVSMRSFFESIGMTFTDSLKGDIVDPYQDIANVTFLKRYFRYHPQLKEITCPLDLKTVYSGLSWLDFSKDTKLVLSDKIHNFQREIFLHWDIYDRDVKKLQIACTNKNLKFTKLPLNYLVSLYKESPDEYFAHLSEKFNYN